MQKVIPDNFNISTRKKCGQDTWQTMNFGDKVETQTNNADNLTMHSSGTSNDGCYRAFNM